MKAFYKLLIASFKQFFRDKVALFFSFAFPILFMVIFGLAFGGNNTVTFNVGLANEDNSAAGSAISQAIRQIPVFVIQDGNLDDLLAGLRRGDSSAVVQVPAGTQENIASGRATEITVYYDPSQTTASQIILPVLQRVINGVNQQLTQQTPLVTIRETSIQTHELRNIDYLVPGIIAMSVLFLGLFGALPLVEWREKQVLKRFGATPLRRSTIVLSQVVYRLVLAVLQTAVIILVAYFAFNVSMLGNWLLLLGFVLLGTLAFVSIGYLAVSRAKTTEGAMPIIQLIQFPMLFLSGIFFPVEFLPGFMRPVINAMPLTYLGDAFRQIMVDATPLHPLAMDAVVLAGWLVVSMMLAIRFFRWE